MVPAYLNETKEKLDVVRCSLSHSLLSALAVYELQQACLMEIAVHIISFRMLWGGSRGLMDRALDL